MKKIFSLCLMLVGLSAMAQLPPILRWPWTTNNNGVGLTNVSTVGGLSATGISNYTTTSISDALSGALIVQDRGSNTFFGLTNPAYFPFGIQGYDLELPMTPMLFGGGVLSSNIPSSGNGTAMTALPSGAWFTNSAVGATNFAMYSCLLPRASIGTNDLEVDYTVWESTNSTFGQSIFNLSWQVISNSPVRWDNLAKTAYGTVTNDHTVTGLGARPTSQRVVLPGTGAAVRANTNNVLFVVQFDRTNGNDTFIAPILIDNGIRLKIRKE